MTTPTAQRPLTERAAEEIRVMLARRRMSQAHLARALNVRPMWVSYRLSGETVITTNDLERIADVLDCAVIDLLPANVGEKVESRRHYPHPVSPVSPRPHGRPRARHVASNTSRPKLLRVPPSQFTLGERVVAE